MKLKVFVLFSLLSISLVTLLFTNCADVAFEKQSESSSLTNPNIPSDEESGDKGVLGGHFDLDTSTQIYPAGMGTTNHHVHEYDDKFNLTVANFFSLADAKFDEIQDVIPPTQEFYLIIHNAGLSPAVDLALNAQVYNVANHKNGMAGSKYSLAGGAGSVKLEKLQFLVKSDAILNKGLVSTQTSCVRRNDAGAKNEYRNGALTIQAVRADNGALLWEGLIFWHEDGGVCR